MQAGKSSVWIRFRINSNINPCSTQLFHHRVQIRHAKIDHPLLLDFAEMLAVFREGRKNCRSAHLRPRLLAVVGWREIDAQILLIPLSRCTGILGTKE